MLIFNKLEKKLLFQFLDELIEDIGGRSCNDFSLPNTPQGRQLFEEMVKTVVAKNYSKVDAAEMLEEQKENDSDVILCADMDVIEFLVGKLKKVLKVL